MNKERRKQLQLVIDEIAKLHETLEFLLDEENEYRENMPENLWNSERFYNSEEASNYIDEAINSLDEATENIENAISL